MGPLTDREAVERFRRAWQGGSTPQLEDYLPEPGTELRNYLLEQMLVVEWEILCRRDKTVRVEVYAGRFSELGPVHELPVGLIYEEYRIRHMYGDAPPLDTYRARFPQQFDSLKQMLHDRPVETLTATPAGRAMTPPPAEGGSGRTKTKPMQPKQTRSGADGDVVVPVGDGGYHILKRLGGGQFGEVFLAEAPGGIQVALKRLFRTVDDKSTQRELEALELLKTLRHPFLLSTLAYGVTDNRPTIIMELADDSLADWFDKCRANDQPGIPSGELSLYFLEAAEALDFLHANHILHRDIKPANLLRMQGHAKVADFGLAREQENDMATATFCGTPLYMGPEMWQNQVSIHSDQYSLAITYAEMRTGQRVFNAKDPFQLARQHLSGTPELTGLTPGERQVIVKALAKEPTDRYPSCTAFARAIAEALAPPPPPPPAPPTPFWRLVATMIGIGLIGGILFAWITPPAAAGRVSPIDRGPMGGLVAGMDAVGPAASWLPPHFDPVGDGPGKDPELVKVDGRHYFRRISRNLAGATPAEFILIPRKDGVEQRDDVLGLPTFYVLRNKVTNSQMAAVSANPEMQKLLERHRQKHDWTIPNKWKVSRKDDSSAEWPVTNVSVTEAHCFAEWLGGAGGATIGRGRLPSRREWDKAGGRYEGKPGPFKDWPGKIAILVGGPLSVDDPRTTDDESNYGCRNMAGNGREWTRDAANFGEPAPPVPLDDPNTQDWVWLRGKSFDEKEPYRFPRQITENQDPTGSSPYDQISPTVGFRTVIAPPAKLPGS
jgi:formylglycine-generating enzyme required for sulfatase activity